jgi:adenylate cyclase
MAFVSVPFSISTRRKLVSILLAVTIFAVLAGLTTLAVGRPVVFGVMDAILVGTAVGIFEEFYVQTLGGGWIRSMHPLRSALVYTIVVVILYLVAMHLSHLILGRLDDLPTAYRRLPRAIPLVVAFSVVGIAVMRVVHFIGAENLFHLMVGTYHRPVLEAKVLVFLDINNSTALAERLGALKTKSLVGKFLFDISKPITDHGGEIYLYKGDGLIALWDSIEAMRGNRLLRSIDAMFATLRRERPEYQREFGVVPTFRVGVHGGDVVVSEQGDTKRSIGVYGDTINIAARMEDAAKLHGVKCVISEEVANMLDKGTNRLLPLGEEKIKGLSVPIRIFEYWPEGETATV